MLDSSQRNLLVSKVEWIWPTRLESSRHHAAIDLNPRTISARLYTGLADDCDLPAGARAQESLQNSDPVAGPGRPPRRRTVGQVVDLATLSV